MFASRQKTVTLTPMKRSIPFILALMLSWSVRAAEVTADQAKSITRLVGNYIGQLHYRNVKLTDEPGSDVISKHHLQNILDTLDYGHMIFLQSDVDHFRKLYDSRLDNLVVFGSMRPGDIIFERYLQRLESRQKLVDELLKEDLKFTTEESFNPVRNKLPWPKTEAEAKELWRKRIKFEVLGDKLTMIKDGVQPDQKKLQESRDKISRRYQRLLKTMKDYKRAEIMDLYLGALTRAYDPHSDYMNPHEVENFNINTIDMQLTGIGAVLRADDGYTTIVRIMPGGPAARSGLLHANDKVIAVQNPDDAKPTDILDMTIDKVVQLIRGKKGTVVKLTIIPSGSDEQKVISIKRDVVKLEESIAKGYIIERKVDGKKVKLGVLNLPSFYGGKNGNCSDHCRIIIERMKKEGIAGLVLDLRRNGGGILQEAVDLTGLFIETGPVVQVKDFRGQQNVLSDRNARVTYNGPLIVAVSHMSASASEIVAAALQDHGRAVVVGGKTTHGKGTVQRLIPLDRKGGAESGIIKFTTSKFYRINGSTTQKDGVVPDIILPSIFDYLGRSEAELPRALEADQIDKAEYKKINQVEAFFTSLRKASKKRLSANTDYKYIQEDITRAKDQKENPSVSLSEKTRLKERADNKSRIEARNKERSGRKPADESYFEISVKIAQDDAPLKKLDPPKPKQENPDPEAIPEDLSHTFDLDPELRETIQILGDFVKLSKRLIGQND